MTATDYVFLDSQMRALRDLDGPSLTRFSETDQRGIEKICAPFCELQGTRERFI